MFLGTEYGQSFLKRRDLVIDSVTGRLMFMRITAHSAGESQDSRAEKIPIRDGWDEYVKSISENPKTPVGLRTVYQDSGIFWAWM